VNTPSILIIGAGPASLMAAEQLAKKGYKVQVYEQNKAAARKFLVAGHGGFNLTHNEDIDSFVLKYDHPRIAEMVRYFDNQATCSWLASLGISTYVGSSGKIFPTKEIKPIMVLNAWLDKLQSLGVKFFYNHRFIDFTEKEVTLEFQGQQLKRSYDKLILGLGGGSWAKTGSTAAWVPLFQEKGIEVMPLQSANSGFNSPIARKELEGQFLKNIVVHYGSEAKKGELVFTSYGIEGSPIYYMNRFVRKQGVPNQLFIDLKPEMEQAQIEKTLASPGKVTEHLKKKIRLQAAAINLLKGLDKAIFLSPAHLAQHIKRFPIAIESFRPIDEVISTAGGVSFKALNNNLSLKAFPNIYCVGEMLDWEAPTGGYLLQACFSAGRWAADKL